MKRSVASLPFQASVPVTREVYLMGTPCVLTTYAATPEAGQEQLETHLRILEDTENELSVWRSGTSLSRLNSTPVGQQFRARERFFKMFEEVVFWCKATGRKFDPTIGKLLQARGFYGKPPNGPSDPPVVGMQHIVLRSDSLDIVREADVWIDSGCFGKGEGLDRVFSRSEREGAEPWLIDLGGQIMVYGRPPGKTCWPIDIADPQQRDRPAMTVDLRSGSLSTTGNSEQPGHVLDPTTGMPVDFNGSVIVWNERALVADILSTALFVMGPEKGIDWARLHRIAACFLLPSGNQLDFVFTEEFASRLEISHSG